MDVQYKDWIIEFVNDYNYNFCSVDNARAYKQVICEINSRPSSKHGIRVTKNHEEISSVTICGGGGASTIHERSFVIDDDEIFLCCGDHVYCLKIPTLTINWRTLLDPATCFGLYHFQNDFLIHGELEVSRVDRKGNKKWSFSARDIFATPDNKQSFEIIGDKIKLRDWEGYEYLINEEGKEIT